MHRKFTAFHLATLEADATFFETDPLLEVFNREAGILKSRYERGEIGGVYGQADDFDDQSDYEDFDDQSDYEDFDDE
ncbi:MAG: hypothetical protein R3C59_17705 [Planctomycetaceae bacterium]